MKVSDLTCTLNMPLALQRRTGADGKEISQELPPYALRPAFLVDQYPVCPPEWPRSSTAEVPQTSYFVPILADRGMWLDFNPNLSHAYYVGVVISIQGINPITGQKTEGINLEQFRDKCPVHNVSFGPERFCKECGYQWDAQNYLAGNVTPYPYFWLDGFRAQDGVVRQYIFTEEKMRGVATQLIGRERVFAIGIAFYLSKNPKPALKEPRYVRRTTFLPENRYGSFHAKDMVIGASLDDRPKSQMLDAGFVPDDDMITEHLAPERFQARSVSPVKKLEIGAGARINQRIFPDPESLDFWQEKPAGIIYVNYVATKNAEEIIAAGALDLTAEGEGFLLGLKTGNPA